MGLTLPLLTADTQPVYLPLPVTMIRTVLASLCLLVALAASEDAAGCQSVCGNVCTVGLSNCHDLKEGMCEKLKTACVDNCAKECSCIEGCEEKCMAEQDKCDKEDQLPAVKVACMMKANRCKVSCPLGCAVKGLATSKCWEDVRARVQELLPEGVKLPDFDISKIISKLPSLEDLQKHMPTIEDLQKFLPLLKPKA